MFNVWVGIAAFADSAGLQVILARCGRAHEPYVLISDPAFIHANPHQVSQCNLRGFRPATTVSCQPKRAIVTILTSLQVAWIIRLAAQESKRGVTSGRITLIHADAIDREAVFHAQPFHKELRKKRPFSNGAFRYQGMREYVFPFEPDPCSQANLSARFLVYHKIPNYAVLYTFTVQELVQLTVRKPAVGDLLRLHHLEKNMTALRTLSQTLQAQNLKLDMQSVPAIAALVCFFTLESSGKTEHIMHIVSDVIQGWSLTVLYHSPQQWLALADSFASAMLNPPLRVGWLKDYQSIKMAFLDGVRWSQGDVNARHKLERMQTMLTRARKIGLEDPGKIVRDELDAAKFNVMTYDRKQQRLLQGRHAGHRVLAAGEDEDDIPPTAPRSKRRRFEDSIVYDTDDNDD